MILMFEQHRRLQRNVKKTRMCLEFMLRFSKIISVILQLPGPFLRSFGALADALSVSQSYFCSFMFVCSVCLFRSFFFHSCFPFICDFRLFSFLFVFSVRLFRSSCSLLISVRLFHSSLPGTNFDKQL